MKTTTAILELGDYTLIQNIVETGEDEGVVTYILTLDLTVINTVSDGIGRDYREYTKWVQELICEPYVDGELAEALDRELFRDKEFQDIVDWAIENNPYHD